MIVKRLSWAGIRLRTGSTRVVIDPLTNVEALEAIGLGRPRSPVLPAEAGTADLVLITHVHPDHCDPDAVAGWLRDGGRVLGPAPVVATLAKAGLRAATPSLYEARSVGELTVSAVPAVDAFGEDQVSWVVTGDGVRVVHCGDSLWHGHWWSIRRRCGDATLVCVPINGVVVEFAGATPSGRPASMLPDDAAAAAHLLGARLAMPIHYGTFHNPPIYMEHDQALERFRTSCRARGVEALVLGEGEGIELGPSGLEPPATE